MTIPHPDASEAKLVQELREEWQRLSGHSLDRGSADAGISANLATKAADTIEALALQLAEQRAEIERWKGVARLAGACMTCALGAPEHFGCTDCLNTGWEGGAPAGFVAEAQLAAANTEIEGLESDLDEARYEPWPKWADEIRKRLQNYGVDTGPENEWDIGHDFEEWLDATVREETRRLTDQLAAANARLAQAEKVIELQSKVSEECYPKARDHLRMLHGDEKPFGEYRRYVAATEEAYIWLTAARAWRNKESGE